MYRDDDDDRPRARREDRGARDGGDGPPRTTRRRYDDEPLPELYSLHKATVVRVAEYGGIFALLSPCRRAICTTLAGFSVLQARLWRFVARMVCNGEVPVLPVFVLVVPRPAATAAGGLPQERIDPHIRAGKVQGAREPLPWLS